MANIGATELILILLVVLLVFGAKRIPEIARGLGQGIREFKSATNDIKREIEVGAQPPRQVPPAQPPYQQPYQQPVTPPTEQPVNPNA